MFTLHLILSHHRDRTRARRLREEFGRSRRWLVSWHRLGRRRWLARLSCPSLAETVEETGRSRCEAIARAERVLRDSLDDRDAPASPGSPS